MASGLTKEYNDMRVTMEIRKNLLSQYFYMPPMDFARDLARNLWVVFRADEKCTFICIDAAQNFKKEDLNFEDTDYHN